MHNIIITTTLHNNIISLLRKIMIDNYNDVNEIKSEALSIYVEMKTQGSDRIKKMITINEITISKDDFNMAKFFSSSHKINLIKYLKEKYSLGLIEAKEMVDYIQ